MWNRQEMLSRIRECQRQGVPITNYGLVIAYVQGILERALEPFPEALAAYHQARNEQQEQSLANAIASREEASPAFVN
jgi:Hydrogen maturase F tetramerization domain